MPHPIKPSWVYFAQEVNKADGPIKIGCTTNPPQRQKNLRFDGHPVHFIGIMPGRRAEEYRLHVQFGMAALGREWFAPQPVLIGFAHSLPIISMEQIIAEIQAYRAARKEIAANAIIIRHQFKGRPRRNKSAKLLNKARRLEKAGKHEEATATITKALQIEDDVPSELSFSMPKLPRHERKYITEAELRILLKEAEGSTLDHALVSLMYNVALRASEVGLLTLEHATYLHKGKLYVVRVKGSHSGWLDIHPTTVKAVMAWINDRYPEKRTKEMRLFPGNRWRGRPAEGLSRWSVTRAIKRLCHRAGLPDIVAHPHSLRHGRVMHILEAAAATPNFHFPTLVPTLAKYLGHAAATTTIEYYMHETKGVHAIEGKMLDGILGIIGEENDV